MANVTVRLDTSDIQRMASEMSRTKFLIAVSRGINDSIKFGRTYAKKEVKRRYNIAPIELSRGGRNDLIPIRLAKRSDLSATVSASVKQNIKLSAFKGVSGAGVKLVRSKDGMSMRKGRKSVSSWQTGKGRDKVQIEIVKGNKVTMDKAFIARMKNGHIGVFGRAGSYSGGKFTFRKKRESSKSDTPIAELGSMSMNKAIDNGNITNNLNQAVSTNVESRVRYWLDRYSRTI